MRILLTRTSDYGLRKIIEIEEEKFFEYLKNLQADDGHDFVVDTDGRAYEWRADDATAYHTELMRIYENILETRIVPGGKLYSIAYDARVEIYDDYRE